MESSESAKGWNEVDAVSRKWFGFLVLLEFKKKLSSSGFSLDEF